MLEPSRFYAGNMPRITVITACLNAARTIEQAVRSVLDQEYPNLEYIIIDGGSTDGTLDIIDKYRGCLSIVVSEPDNGIYDAFNKGIRRATGDLIGILNADDFYAPWTLSAVSRVYAEHPAHDVYFGKVILINIKKKRWILCPLGEPQNLTYRMDEMSPSHPAIFVPKKTYDKYGVYDVRYRITGDWDYFLGLFLKGASFCPIDEALTAFRASGISSHISDRHLLENQWVYSKYFNKFEAFKRNTKMYLKHHILLFMKKMRIYDIYIKFRERNVIFVEHEGKYDNDDVDSMWNALAKPIR
jgi:glycosyltransferase involved in cell wall biosynthesis